MPGSSGNGCGEKVGEGGRIATATVMKEKEKRRGNS